MKPILVPCVDGSEKGLQCACANSKGTLYLVYGGEIRELHPSGKLEVVYSGRCAKRKAEAQEPEGSYRIRTIAESPHGLLCVFDGECVKILRDGRIEGVIPWKRAGAGCRIGFLPNGNTLLLEQSENEQSVHEYEGGASRGGTQLREITWRSLGDRTYSYSDDVLCKYGSTAIVWNECIETAFTVEGEWIDPDRVATLDWPEDEFIATATATRGDLYHIGICWETRAQTLYKNCAPLLRLPDCPEHRCQLTSHLSSGLYVTQEDRVSRVVTDPKWSVRTHRHFDNGVKEAIKALMVVRRRDRCQVGRLPLDVLFEVFDWVLR